MHRRCDGAKEATKCDLNLQVMGRLIEFAYTASISVGEKCVIHVMNGAVMYQIDSVVKACCDFLVQQLDPSNAIGIANFAEQIGCTELHQKAREYIYMNFSQVRMSCDTDVIQKGVSIEHLYFKSHDTQLKKNSDTVKH